MGGRVGGRNACMCGRVGRHACMHVAGCAEEMAARAQCAGVRRCSSKGSQNSCWPGIGTEKNNEIRPTVLEIRPGASVSIGSVKLRYR